MSCILNKLREGRLDLQTGAPVLPQKGTALKWMLISTISSIAMVIFFVGLIDVFDMARRAFSEGNRSNSALAIITGIFIGISMAGTGFILRECILNVRHHLRREHYQAIDTQVN